MSYEASHAGLFIFLAFAAAGIGLGLWQLLAKRKD